MVSRLPGMAYRLAKGDGWRLVEISDQVLDLTGYSAREFLDRKVTFFEITLAEDADYVRKFVRQSLEEDGQFSLQYRIQTRAGEIKYLWERGQGVFSESGELTEIVGFVFDSSSHQLSLKRINNLQKVLLHLARSENLRRGLLDQFLKESVAAVARALEVDRVSVWFVDETGNYIDEVCAYRLREQVVASGERLEVASYPNYFEALASGRALDIYDAVNDPRSHEGDVDSYIENNNIASMLDVAIRKSGELIGIFSIEQMDNKRYWSTEEVSLANEMAELINQVLSNRELLQVESRLLEMQAANEAKRNFLGIMSHELRTPLNGVMGVAELLSMTSLDDQQRDYVNNIENSGRHLLQVIGAVIDLADLQDGRLTLDVRGVDVQDLLREVIRTVKAEAVAKGLDLNFQLERGIPEQILLDGQRLQQICFGLLSNAIKYTDQGAVSVSVAMDQERRELAISVRDTGQGIPDELMGKLFTPFVQQRNLTLGGSLRGAGLSLAICYELAKLMGGQLTAESTEGQGSTFTLSLPADLGEPDSAAAPFAVAEPRSVDALKILVVEDNSVNQKVARGLLRKFGIEADVCDDGAQAVSKVASSREGYDLILMDCEMPVMNGFDATQAIRNLPAPQGEVHIAALTAHAVREYQQKARQAGMDNFLTKPLTKNRLERLLQEVLSS